MREIVLDTETTGFDPESGDRIVEIGAVELMGHVATGDLSPVYQPGTRHAGRSVSGARSW
jgi:DNA polymerase III epsilon subunit-like protein